MIALEKLLGKEDRFFQLLEASAEQARKSVQGLRQFLQNRSAPGGLQALASSRREEKALNTQISELLCTSVVSAMEVEDIAELANCIYKIPKTVEKIAERIQLAPQHLEGTDLTGQVVMLEKATDTLLSLVRELHKGMSPARARALNDQLQAVEGEGDRVVNERLRELYNSHDHSGRVVFLKDLFELIEKVTDRCRDAGNVILQIVLKNS
jgi:hypothetical protein